MGGGGRGGDGGKERKREKRRERMGNELTEEREEKDDEENKERKRENKTGGCGGWELSFIMGPSSEICGGFRYGTFEERERNRHTRIEWMENDGEKGREVNEKERV